MPKNTGKGGKQRKRGKNANEQSKREIVTAAEGEAYATVIAPMGNYQMSIRLDDMTTATGIVRGALRKKVWIVTGDLIRVQLRTGFEEGTVDIVGKYTHNEAQDLVKQGVVPQALISGPGGASSAGVGGKNSMYQNITFVNQTATVAESAKDKQGQEKSRNKNIDMVAIMKNPNRAGIGIGDSDDENGPEDNPMRGWKPNKRQDDSDDDDDEEDEDEEDEEGEEGEEEEEEEEEDEAMNADAYYDAGRADNQADWNKHHNNKKDQDYKQRNKRAKENQTAGAKGVTAEDVSDI